MITSQHYSVIILTTIKKSLKSKNFRKYLFSSYEKQHVTPFSYTENIFYTFRTSILETLSTRNHARMITYATDSKQCHGIHNKS